jgi:hypothetical protein
MELQSRCISPIMELYTEVGSSVLIDSKKREFSFKSFSQPAHLKLLLQMNLFTINIIIMFFLSRLFKRIPCIRFQDLACEPKNITILPKLQAILI